MLLVDDGFGRISRPVNDVSYGKGLFSGAEAAEEGEGTCGP